MLYPSVLVVKRGQAFGQRAELFAQPLGQRFGGGGVLVAERAKELLPCAVKQLDVVIGPGAELLIEAACAFGGVMLALFPFGQDRVALGLRVGDKGRRPLARLGDDALGLFLGGGDQRVGVFDRFGRERLGTLLRVGDQLLGDRLGRQDRVADLLAPVGERVELGAQIAVFPAKRAVFLRQPRGVKLKAFQHVLDLCGVIVFFLRDLQPEGGEIIPIQRHAPTALSVSF